MKSKEDDAGWFGVFIAILCVVTVFCVILKMTVCDSYFLPEPSSARDSNASSVIKDLVEKHPEFMEMARKKADRLNRLKEMKKECDNLEEEISHLERVKSVAIPERQLEIETQIQDKRAALILLGLTMIAIEGEIDSINIKMKAYSVKNKITIM